MYRTLRDAVIAALAVAGTMDHHSTLPRHMARACPMRPDPSSRPFRARWTLVLRALTVLPALLGAGAAAGAWNDPYPREERLGNTLYSSFRERPKHLDPGRSYSSDEYVFVAQIYEPPLQYHFLIRPYTLVPLSAEALPTVRYLNGQGEPMSGDADARAAAFTEYEFRIRPGIRYQPHPALARDADGDYLYHALAPARIARLHRLADLPGHGTREVLAADFVHQVKRLADPAVHSPIAGVMKQYIVGFEELEQAIARRREELPAGAYVDLRDLPLAGASVLGPHRYSLRIKGRYPQFLYWQAMPFFAPIPWEAERFYSQPGLEEKNISLDWYPIGSGPFYLSENNPNLRMVMARNPHYHGESYPREGASGDRELGLLGDAGRPLPFIDKAVYSLEKESIPRWNKFLQGYYDSSGIGSDSFDQAVQFDAGAEATLTDEMRERGIQLYTSVSTTIIYMGFNMLDPVIGGDSERARLLRRAISIAVDFEEYISIFLNDRGVAAQGPIPPGIFGYREGKAGINRYVYDEVDGAAQRKSLDEARALMEQAGYADGRNASGGEPLVLNFEALSRGPDDKARLSWIRKQFAKIGIQLVVRATDYNRFREKMLKGTGQIFMWGWNADYPDPENFFFLLYGPNSKAQFNGENAANYQSAEFDALFERMKNMPNGPRRQRIVDEMTEIVRRDAPWVWGFHPKEFTLYHGWYHNVKPNLMANNTLKYGRIDAGRRESLRRRWNPPVLWPVALIVVALLSVLVPAVTIVRRRERSTAL